MQKNKKKQKKKCASSLLCFKALRNQCKLHSNRQLDIIEAIQNSLGKKLLLISLKDRFEVFQQPLLPIYVANSLLYKNNLLYEGIILQIIYTDKQRREALSFKVERQVGSLGENQKQINWLKSNRFYFQPYISRQQAKQLHKEGQLKKGMFYVNKRLEQTIRQQESKQLIYFRKQRPNRCLHRQQVYFNRDMQVVHSIRQRRLIAGVLISSNEFRPIKLQYPNMIIQSVAPQLINQITDSGLFSLFIPTIKKEFVGNFIFIGYCQDWHPAFRLPSIMLSQLIGQVDQQNFVKAILRQTSTDLEHFQKKVLKEGKAIQLRASQLKADKFKDLRYLNSFSIDSKATKNKQDAVSIVKFSQNLYRVYLHISNVEYFVPRKSALSSEAERRVKNTYASKYQYVPIFPRQVSKSLCLKKGRESLVKTFSFITDGVSIFNNYQFNQSVIQLKQEFIAQHLIDKQQKFQVQLAFIQRVLNQQGSTQPLTFIQWVKTAANSCLYLQLHSIQRRIRAKNQQILSKLTVQKKTFKSLSKQKIKAQSDDQINIQPVDQKVQIQKNYVQEKVIQDNKFQSQIAPQLIHKAMQEKQQLDKIDLLSQKSSDSQLQQGYLKQKLNLGGIKRFTAQRAKPFLIECMRQMGHSIDFKSIKSILKCWNRAQEEEQIKGNLIKSEYLKNLKITNKQYFGMMIQEQLKQKKNPEIKQKIASTGKQDQLQLFDNSKQAQFKQQPLHNKNQQQLIKSQPFQVQNIIQQKPDIITQDLTIKTQIEQVTKEPKGSKGFKGKKKKQKKEIDEKQSNKLQNDKQNLRYLIQRIFQSQQLLICFYCIFLYLFFLICARMFSIQKQIKDSLIVQLVQQILQNTGQISSSQPIRQKQFNQFDLLNQNKKINWTRPLRQYQSLEGQRLVYQLICFNEDLRKASNKKELRNLANRSRVIKSDVKYLYLYKSQNQVIQQKSSNVKQILREIQKFKMAVELKQKETKMKFLTVGKKKAWNRLTDQVDCDSKYKKYQEVQLVLRVKSTIPVIFQCKKAQD